MGSSCESPSGANAGTIAKSAADANIESEEYQQYYEAVSTFLTTKVQWDNISVTLHELSRVLEKSRKDAEYVLLCQHGAAQVVLDLVHRLPDILNVLLADGMDSKNFSHLPATKKKGVAGSSSNRPSNASALGEGQSAIAVVSELKQNLMISVVTDSLKILAQIAKNQVCRIFFLLTDRISWLSGSVVSCLECLEALEFREMRRCSSHYKILLSGEDVGEKEEMKKGVAVAAPQNFANSTSPKGNMSNTETNIGSAEKNRRRSQWTSQPNKTIKSEHFHFLMLHLPQVFHLLMLHLKQGYSSSAKNSSLNSSSGPVVQEKPPSSKETTASETNGVVTRISPTDSLASSNANMSPLQSAMSKRREFDLNKHQLALFMLLSGMGDLIKSRFRCATLYSSKNLPYPFLQRASIFLESMVTAYTAPFGLESIVEPPSTVKDSTSADSTNQAEPVTTLLESNPSYENAEHALLNKNRDIMEVKKVLHRSDFFGAVNLLGALLLSPGARVEDPLSQSSLSMAIHLFKLFNAMTLVDLADLQQCLGGSEGPKMSELFHIVVFVFDYCCYRLFPKDSTNVELNALSWPNGQKECAVHPANAAGSCNSQNCFQEAEILHELIIFLGHFCLLHPKNQGMMQLLTYMRENEGGIFGMNESDRKHNAENSGTAEADHELKSIVNNNSNTSAPTLLTKLSSLPFEEYFLDDAKKKHILFPTLICCIFKNKANMDIFKKSTSPLYIMKYLEHMMSSKDRDERHFTNSNKTNNLTQKIPPKLWCKETDSEMVCVDSLCSTHYDATIRDKFASRFSANLWAEARAEFAQAAGVE